MPERKTPTMRVSRPIKRQPDTKRTDKAAGIAAHAVQPHGGAAQLLVGSLRGAAVKAELSK